MMQSPPKEEFALRGSDEDKRRFPYPSVGSIEGIRVDTESALHLSALLRLCEVVLVISFKCEIVNSMGEVMPVSIVTEVGYEFMNIHVVCLERASERELKISNHLIHSDASRNITTF